MGVELRVGGLVLYKSRPACVKAVEANGRIDIDTGDGSRKVRPKDVVALHPGPATVHQLAPPEAIEEVATVRDLLGEEGEPVDLETLAEWLYGSTTPAAVWAAWQFVEAGLHFEGTPDHVQVRSADQVAADLEKQQKAAAEKAAWSEFLERMQKRSCTPEDEIYLRDVVGLALGQRDDARALKALQRSETPDNAHAALLEVGWWSATDLPYLERGGHSGAPPAVALEEPQPVERLDLTHLTAFAIDDEGNQDPDDAIGLDDEGRVWVHVADVAAFIPPGSAADTEARDRGATLYLPDGPIPMAPQDLAPRVGLGLAADGIGEALSFCLDVSPDGEVRSAELALTRVRVERLTYAEADPKLVSDDRLKRLRMIADESRKRRLAHGALDLDWPEVRIRVRIDGDEPDIDLQPLPRLASRHVVAEMMILAGGAAARLGRERGLPLPFSVQEAAAEASDDSPVDGLAGAYALRRRQQPARISGEAGAHRGLGMDAYVRATSPIRRYVDLLVHQQLRASLTGSAPLDEATLMERAVQGEQGSYRVRGIERQANRHWTLLWLQQHKWTGPGVVVDTRGRRALIVCPDVALETWAPVGEGVAVGNRYNVVVRSIDLPRLDVHVELTPA